MKVLLDTHALLWLAEGSPQLSTPARQAIRQADECLVSIASLWEMAIKCAIDNTSHANFVAINAKKMIGIIVISAVVK